MKIWLRGIADIQPQNEPLIRERHQLRLKLRGDCNKLQDDYDLSFSLAPSSSISPIRRYHPAPFGGHFHSTRTF